jgi:uncharacterized membrane protein
MKTNSKRISIIVIFAALYAVGVIFLAPISYSFFQVRLADALLPLSMIFGIPSAIGLSLGCLVSNVYGGLGLVDIIGGTVANFLACTLAWYVARSGNSGRRFIGTILQTIIITVIVGGYLWIIFEVPIEFSIAGVFVGSLIAINVLGFSIQEILRRNKPISNYAE